MSVRTGAWIAVCVATFAVGVLLGRGCADPTTNGDDVPSSGSPAASAPGASERRSVSDARRRAADTASAETESPRPASLPARGDESVDATNDVAHDFPFLDVEVVWPDGAPAGGGPVYAYPAGETSAGLEPPNTPSDAAGRAQLHVVAPGRYDVGALLGAFQVLATDVELPRSGPLRLVLPEPCRVTVHMPERAGAATGATTDPHRQLRLIQVAARRVSLPGHGEMTGGWDGGVVGPPGSKWEAWAPLGARCRIEHDARFRVEPEEVVAPAVVRIVALPRYRADVRIEWKPAGRAFDRDTTIGFWFLQDDDGSRWKRW